jgi:hypothetical protein
MVSVVTHPYQVLTRKPLRLQVSDSERPYLESTSNPTSSERHLPLVWFWFNKPGLPAYRL